MGTYITPSGFLKKTYEECLLEKQTSLRTVFGQEISMDPTSRAGQLAISLAMTEYQKWEIAEEIYTSRIRSQATASALDDIGEYVNVRRADASPTTVNSTTLFGEVGTTIPAGSKARQANNAANFSLASAVTISNTSCRSITLVPNTTTVGIAVSVLIDAVAYSYTIQTGDVIADIVAALVSSIDAGAFSGTVTNVDDAKILLEYTIDFSVIPSTYLTMEDVGSNGVFVADVDGPVVCPVYMLNVIVTPVTGWDAVSNPDAGIAGTNVESDHSYRLRMSQTTTSGFATADAIRNHILNTVSGVTSVIVDSNRTDTTDVTGAPPHSFEVVVAGNFVQAELAEAIWTASPVGIPSHGDITTSITDSTGKPQTIKYSTPVNVNIYVTVSRGYSEEDYPTGGDALIKEEIVNYAAANYYMGKDVYSSQLFTPVMKVPGLGNVTIAIGTTAPGAGTLVAMGSTQIAAFDVARITVQDI